jgi:hypothetical protein
MKKYIELKAGDTLAINDERASNNGYEAIEAEAVGTAVDRFHEQYKIFRRPIPHAGDVQFLMQISILVPVIVNCDGREQESIEAEAGELAYQKVLDDPRKYVSYENVDWANCKVDELQPEPKNPGKYRYLEALEPIEDGDEELLNGKWKKTGDVGLLLGPNAAKEQLYRRKILAEQQYRILEAGEIIMPGDQMRDKEVVQWFNCDATVGCTVDEDEPYEYRRPIPAEPQYRPFKDGDVIEEGDQVRYKEEWLDYNPSSYGQFSEYVIDSRKLIK